MDRPRESVVSGQPVDFDKLQAARERRRRMTAEERMVWQAVRAGRLQGLHFRRQQVIDGFIVDFYCHAAKLVVEIDGDVHREQAGHDEERDRILAHRGLRILRFRNEEVQCDLSAVLTRIAAEALR